MIYVTGDTHGDIDYRKLLKLNKKNLSYNDFLIICGDAGICWSPQSFQYHLDLYNDIGCTIILVDGNHENFDMLNQCPLVEYHGNSYEGLEKNAQFSVNEKWNTMCAQVGIDPNTGEERNIFIEALRNIRNL